MVKLVLGFKVRLERDDMAFFKVMLGFLVIAFDINLFVFFGDKILLRANYEIPASCDKVLFGLLK